MGENRPVHPPNIPWHRCLRWTWVLLILACHSMFAHGQVARSHYVHISVGGADFQVELAKTAYQWRRGLMFRDSLAAGTGMLFVQASPRPVEFWMKNMQIPLDILYFDADRKLLAIHAEVPPCRLEDARKTPPACPTLPSRQPVKYVLEINTGSAKRMGLNLGDQLTIHQP